MFFYGLRFLLVCVLVSVPASAWIDYPDQGFASMTHYDLPRDFVAACGCDGESTHYPTVALSQMAYGSSTAYGSGCGRCFNLTLLNTFLSDPPFYPQQAPSIVVKVIDLCPYFNGGEWCNATATKPNAAGHFLNFDLAFPSAAIPSDFFPSNVTLYGYADFGVWNISYAVVNCSSWAGGSDQSALKAVANQGPEAVCCPGNPTDDNKCASYSDNNGIPADKTQGSGSGGYTVHVPVLLLIVSLTTVLFATHTMFKLI